MIESISASIINLFYFIGTDHLSNGIEQLRTCSRCHRIFPVLSDLFNHMCDDDDDLLRTKSVSSSPQTSDNILNNKNDNKTTLNSSAFFDTTPPTNQESSPSSSKSFKLNAHSSLNNSSTSSLRSRKLFSPKSSILKQHSNTTSECASPTSTSIHSKSLSDTIHIPLFQRPLLRQDPTSPRHMSSSPSPSPRQSVNNKSKYLSSAYVYLRNPASPMRIVS